MNSLKKIINHQNAPHGALWLFVVLFLVCGLHLSSAQEIIAENKVSLKAIDIVSGLSNNNIRDIQQDKYGFVWVATDEGLNRLFGSKVHKYFKQADDSGLSGNELNCLLNDSSHSTMWVGTQRAGLVAIDYDTNEVRTFKHNPDDAESLVSNDITCLRFGDDNRIWLSTYYNGLDCFDPESGNAIHYNTQNVIGLKSDQIWTFIYDSKSQTIFAGHEHAGFSIIDVQLRTAKQYTVADGFPGKSVYCLCKDGNTIWIGTDNGLCSYNLLSEKIELVGEPVFLEKCQDVVNIGDALLVAMHGFGVVSFDKKTHAFRRLDPQYTSKIADFSSILYKCRPTDIFIDSFGDVLVGTLGEEIIALSSNTSFFFIDNHLFKSGNNSFNLAPVDVNAIAISPTGEMTYSTFGDGLYSEHTQVQQNRNKYGSFITFVLADGNSNIWITDNDGILTHIDTETGRKGSFDLDVPNSENNSIVAKGDTLLIGTYKGLVVFDKTKREIVAKHDIGNNFIFPVKTDNKGNLYVGTFGDGLYILDGNMNNISHLCVGNGFPSNTINDIHIHGRYIWVATSEGLVRIDSMDYGKYEIIASPLRSIYAVISDNQGNLWYSTGAGIGVVMTDGAHKFYDRELPLSGFNVASVAKHPSGRLYFGTNRGVVTFSPEYVISNKWVSRPVISNFIVNTSNKNFDFIASTRSDDIIDLAYDQNNFTLVINTLNFFFQNGTFEYRLKGIDDTWYEMKGANEITYRDLPYGKYEFQIKNPNGVSEIVTLKIHIRPPFWLAWWAKTLYLLLALGVIYYIVVRYKSRLRKKSDTELEENKQAHIQELNDERLKFFTNITHELRTPLTLIMGPLDDINQNSSLDEKDKWKIQIIHKNAQRLLNLVNQILDFRKTETQNKRLCVSKGNIVKAVKDVSMKYVELNRNPNITISVTSSVDEIMAYFDNEVITMILDNLISNALKYTEVGLVSVSVIAELAENKRVVRISVKDTGYGISQDALPHIFDRYYQEKSSHQASGTGIGLALVRALVELHQGKITVESAKDVGTCFSITFDRDNEYPEALHSETLSDDNAIDHTESEVIQPCGVSQDESSPDSIVVLVVEDNPDILEYVEQSFSGIFDIKTASNGRDGLELAKSIVPDIIVTDVMMPVMDGLEMSKLLKRDMATSHIPIIMLTAKDSISDKEAGYKIGVDSYLTKPFNSSLLLTRINNIIAQRRMMSEYFRSRVAEITTARISPESAQDEHIRMETTLSKVDREFIERLDNAIIDNLSSEKVNIDYLTDSMCMSRASLYRKIKALTGMSSNEYIRAIRMRIARDLLLEETMTITEISEKVGCSSPTYFRESFKAFYGVSPSQYSKNSRQS